MTDPSETAPVAREHSTAPAGVDPAGPLDEDQRILIDEVVDDEADRPLGLTISKDDRIGIYDATIGGQEVGGLTYNDDGRGRIVLVAVSILPQFRKQGAATKLIRHVLDDIRAQGKKATILCPIVRTFIDKHSEYQDVVDPEHPGVVKVAPR